MTTENDKALIIQETEHSLADFEKKREAIVEELSRVDAGILSMRERLTFLIFGVKKGSRVIDDRGRKYVVVEVDTRGYTRGYWWATKEKPWLYGHLILKNGEVSEARRLTIYRDWKLIEEPEGEQ